MSSDADAVYAGITFPITSSRPLGGSRPYTVINMVASLDGKAASGGKVGSMGSRIDRTLMRTLRAHVDAVMTGAGTVRAEKLTLDIPESLARDRTSRGLKPHPLAVVLTTTGEVPLDINLTGPSPDNLLILVPPNISEAHFATLSSRASAIETIETVPKEESARGAKLDLKKALKTLKERYSVDILLVEGGPTLNHTLVYEDLADELFLTLAPKLLGGEIPSSLTILEGPPIMQRKVEILSIHLCGNELFLRYSLQPL